MKSSLSLLLALIALLTLAGCATSGAKPTLVTQVPPYYPFEMKRQGIEGKVVLEFVVDEAGLPESIRVVSSTNPGFNDAAIAAVQKWRYNPGMVNNRPVKTLMQAPIGFKLDR